METADDHIGLTDQPKLLCEVMSTLAESPVWDDRRQVLFWCDILQHKLRSASLTGGYYREWSLPGTVSSLGLCQSGKLIVACGMQILFLDPEKDSFESLHTIPGQDDIPFRLNDGRVGPDGAFWVGTMHNVALADMQPYGALWRITSTETRCVQTNLTCPNGLAFSLDGKIMWQSDSVQKWIRKRNFDGENGTFDEGKLVARMTEETGRPDGGCLDTEGRYWSAGVSAGVLNVFAPDGSRQIGAIETPVPHPTMPCFAGPELGMLVVTSHRHNMSEASLRRSPHAGGVWIIPTKAKGLPPFRFKDV